MKRLLAALLVSLSSACDDPKSSSTVDASAEAAPPPPPPARTGEGCARAGTLDAVETDPTCVMPKVGDDVMKDFGRRLALRLDVEPETVIAGSTAVLRLTIANVASTETLVVFDAYPKGQSPRPDWTRLSGVPDVKGEQPDLPRPQLVRSRAAAQHPPVQAPPPRPLAGRAADSSGRSAPSRHEERFVRARGWPAHPRCALASRRQAHVGSLLACAPYSGARADLQRRRRPSFRSEDDGGLAHPWRIRHRGRRSSARSRAGRAHGHRAGARREADEAGPLNQNVPPTPPGVAVTHAAFVDFAEGRST